MPALLAQLPEAASTAYTMFIGVIVVGLLTFGGLFAGLRTLRSNLADELKRELQNAAQAQRVDVQSPLDVNVKPAEEFVRKAEHRQEMHEVKEELKRHAARRAEIYDSLKEANGEIRSIKATNEAQSLLLTELRSDSKANASKVDTMIGEQRQLTTQLHQLTIALQRLSPRS